MGNPFKDFFRRFTWRHRAKKDEILPLSSTFDDPSGLEASAMPVQLHIGAAVSNIVDMYCNRDIFGADGDYVPVAPREIMQPIVWLQEEIAIFSGIDIAHPSAKIEGAAHLVNVLKEAPAYVDVSRYPNREKGPLMHPDVPFHLVDRTWLAVNLPKIVTSVKAKNPQLNKKENDFLNYVKVSGGLIAEFRITAQGQNNGYFGM